MTVNSINTYIVPTAPNEVTMPSQPTFLAFLGAGDTDLNVTGNAAQYVLGSGNNLTEVFDQNADFDNTTGIFTAPVTARYFFAHSIFYLQAAGTNIALTAVVTSNRDYAWESGGDINAANNGSAKMQLIVDMDATDTAFVILNLTGIGANTADAQGSATLGSYISGNLQF